MDALELLREDHVRAMTVMRALGRTEGPESRQALLAQLERDLDVHEAIEEEIFYPALRSKATEMVIEGLEEHQIVDKLLGELDSLPFDHETWGARCRVMIGNVEHHMREEEVELFARARKVLGRRRLAELGARMERRRNEFVGRAWVPQPAGA